MSSFTRRLQKRMSNMDRITHVTRGLTKRQAGKGAKKPPALEE